MAISRFIPQIWHAQLLKALEKSLVYAQPGVVNRNYEGDIAQAGDTVRITSISDPTISTYTANTDMAAVEELSDAQRSLVIDQQYSFNFQVDDLDARQAKGDVMPEAMSRAAYKLRDKVDLYCANLYTNVPVQNSLSAGAAIAVTTSTPTDAYDKILVPLSVKLDEANVTTEGRWLVAPPWLHGRLLLDNRFVKVNESGTSSGLRNAVVGNAAGFTILKSNNVPLVTGDDYAVMCGIDQAITFAEQINKMVAYSPERRMADAVKGLHVWGMKVIRPEMLAYALVSQT